MILPDPVLASIVVPTYRRLDYLERCLTALETQSLAGNLYEIVVADDANDPATRELVERRAETSRCQLRYVPVGPVHGPAAARNCGWREAQGEIIAFTDDDCIPDQQWLEQGIRGLMQNPEASAAWGTLIMPIPPQPTDYEKDAAGLASAVFVTANCFVRQSALVRVGGFDQRFRVAWREDSDLFYSLLENNCSVIHIGRAIVVHPVRRAEWGVSIKQQYKSRFDVLLYRKHPQLYRKHVPRFPALYWIIVLSGVCAIITALTGSNNLSLALFATWAGGTLLFTLRRLHGTVHSPEHVAEMLVTSAVIPWLAVYHRLAGYLLYGNAKAKRPCVMG